MRAWSIACALALGIATSGGPLHANGRFPRAERLRENADEPAQLVLAATYGLLVTNDRGTEWRHVCELGYAFSIDDVDPLVELPPDGALLVTAAHSLNRAPAGFCAFQAVLGGAGTETVVDYALDAADRSHVVAAFVRYGNGSVVNELHESRDAGRTFAPFATLPQPAVEFALTLDLAPSDANRLYISALGEREPAVLVRSDDAGATFTTFPLSLDAEEFPYVAAVHPTKPDALYVRTDRWMLDEAGRVVAADRLLYSDDGGESFREIHGASGKLFGFALSPDGSEVVVGYGDPVDPSRSVDPAALGIYRASTSDHSFTKIFEGPVSCLEWTRQGLYVCTSQAERGFALGVAPDARFTLADSSALTPLLDLDDVTAPLECPAGARPAWSVGCAEATLGHYQGSVPGGVLRAPRPASSSRHEAQRSRSRSVVSTLPPPSSIRHPRFGQWSSPNVCPSS